MSLIFDRGHSTPSLIEARMLPILGSEESRCGGWLKDSFGLSWQVVVGMAPEIWNSG
jgi:predicted 3-demethylubiquinone-9 3-methyltransferase (glyoxalase superfamily)